MNSTLACSLVASKVNYNSEKERPAIVHVEAGLRSFDRSMPEEINRIVTDHIADLLFVTEESARINLLNEGISDDKIFFVGNTMIDSLINTQNQSIKSIILDKLGFSKPGCSASSEKAIGSHTPYALLTLHRPANVDNKEIFRDIIAALMEISKDLEIIFPIHPRTLGRIREFKFENHFNFKKMEKNDMKETILMNDNNIYLIDPVGHRDFMCLMMNAKIVLTDSGGIQEETTFLRIPCITLRENTERPVTVNMGTNIVAGVDKDKIINAYNFQKNRQFHNSIPKYWDGKAGQRIIDTIVKVQKES